MWLIRAGARRRHRHELALEPDQSPVPRPRYSRAGPAPRPVRDGNSIQVWRAAAVPSPPSPPPGSFFLSTFPGSGSFERVHSEPRPTHPDRRPRGARDGQLVALAAHVSRSGSSGAASPGAPGHLEHGLVLGLAHPHPQRSIFSSPLQGRSAQIGRAGHEAPIPRPAKPGWCSRKNSSAASARPIRSNRQRFGALSGRAESWWPMFSSSSNPFNQHGLVAPRSPSSTGSRSRALELEHLVDAATHRYAGRGRPSQSHPAPRRMRPRPAQPRPMADLADVSFEEKSRRADLQLQAVPSGVLVAHRDMGARIASNSGPASKPPSFAPVGGYGGQLLEAVGPRISVQGPRRTRPGKSQA